MKSSLIKKLLGSTDTYIVSWLTVMVEVFLKSLFLLFFSLAWLSSKSWWGLKNLFILSPQYFCCYGVRLVLYHCCDCRFINKDVTFSRRKLVLPNLCSAEQCVFVYRDITLGWFVLADISPKVPLVPKVQGDKIKIG